LSVIIGCVSVVEWMRRIRLSGCLHDKTRRGNVTAAVRAPLFETSRERVEIGRSVRLSGLARRRGNRARRRRVSSPTSSATPDGGSWQRPIFRVGPVVMSHDRVGHRTSTAARTGGRVRAACPGRPARGADPDSRGLARVVFLAYRTERPPCHRLQPRLVLLEPPGQSWRSTGVASPRAHAGVDASPASPADR
jgi:hypothetical protein